MMREQARACGIDVQRGVRVVVEAESPVVRGEVRTIVGGIEVVVGDARELRAREHAGRQALA